MADDEKDNRTIPPLKDDGGDMTDEQKARQVKSTEPGDAGAGPEQPEGIDQPREPAISGDDQRKEQTSHSAPPEDAGTDRR